jgi:ABC-type polysaccharide/polyol phosphate export permease
MGLCDLNLIQLKLFEEAMRFLSLDSIIRGWNLGRLDLKVRYRRSILGPIWLSISYFITVVFLSFVWTKVFNQNIENFIWYFSIGLLLWSYLVGVINSSFMLFTENAGFLLNINIDKDILISRNLARELHVLFHLLIVLIILAFFIRPNVGAEQILMSFIGLFVLTIILYNLSYLVSILVLRYRDTKEIISTIINLLYYVTPILWPIENLKGSEYIYINNPFFHLVNIVRAPLVNGLYWHTSIVVSTTILIIIVLLKIYVKKKYDKFVALWI